MISKINSRKTVCKRGHLRINNGVYKTGHCKQCAILRQRRFQLQHPRLEYQQNYHLKYKYNISKSDYDLMFMQQQGKCYICQDSSQKLIVDHNHKTKQVRKLLCNNCNAMIGFSKENSDTLKVAAAYVNHDFS